MGVKFKQIDEERAKIYLEKTLTTLREAGILDFETFKRKPYKIIYSSIELKEKIINSFRETLGLIIKDFPDATIIDASLISLKQLKILKDKGLIKSYYKYFKIPSDKMIKIIFYKDLDEAFNKPEISDFIIKALLENTKRIHEFITLTKLFEKAINTNEAERDKIIKQIIEKYHMEGIKEYIIEELEELKEKLKELGEKKNIKYEEDPIATENLEDATNTLTLKFFYLISQGQDPREIVIVIPSNEQCKNYIGIKASDLQEIIREKIEKFEKEINATKYTHITIKPIIRNAKVKMNWLIIPTTILLFPELFSKNTYQIILNRLKLTNATTHIITCKKHIRNLYYKSKAKYNAFQRFITLYKNIKTKK